MRFMWFMEVIDLVAKTIVFSEKIMKEYLESGYTVTGKYKISLIEGSNFLPDYCGDE